MAEDSPEKGMPRGPGRADATTPEPRPKGACLQDPDFCQAQEEDPSLQRLRQSVAVDDGQVKNAHRAGCLLQVECVQGLWWRLVPPTPRNPEGRQLVVPEGYLGQVLGVAHDSPWVGHQGPKKMAAWALQFFFWPSVSADMATHCWACPACQMSNAWAPP